MSNFTETFLSPSFTLTESEAPKNCDACGKYGEGRLTLRTHQTKDGGTVEIWSHYECKNKVITPYV